VPTEAFTPAVMSASEYAELTYWEDYSKVILDFLGVSRSILL